MLQRPLSCQRNSIDQGWRLLQLQLLQKQKQRHRIHPRRNMCYSQQCWFSSSASSIPATAATTTWTTTRTWSTTAATTYNNRDTWLVTPTAAVMAYACTSHAARPNALTRISSYRYSSVALSSSASLPLMQAGSSISHAVGSSVGTDRTAASSTLIDTNAGVAAKESNSVPSYDQQQQEHHHQQQQQQQNPQNSNQKHKSLFSLPSIFSRSSATNGSDIAAAAPLLEHSLIDYPWLLSTAPTRETTPSFWQALRDKHYLGVATERTKDLLHHPVYRFPSQFLTDTSESITAIFKALSDPAMASSPEMLEPLMVRGLINHFAPAYDSLAARGHRPKFILHSTPSIRLKSIMLTYGPYPPPEGYVMQDWFKFLRLIIPRTDADFETHPRQREIFKAAQDEGVFIRATVVVNCDLEFVIEDIASGDMPLLRDRRSRFEIQFVSPHFTPWDNLFVAEGDPLPVLTSRDQVQGQPLLQEGEVSPSITSASTPSADLCTPVHAGTVGSEVQTQHQDSPPLAPLLDKKAVEEARIHRDMFKKETLRQVLAWKWRMSDIDGLLGERSTNNTERTS
ncbi:hypothetical protein BASA60_004579 [Batrachochytrium salamandrivorans]|nr:hypothetical protein BASA60_004579 [Batrachochytrium salamandrivorans]